MEDVCLAVKGTAGEYLDLHRAGVQQVPQRTQCQPVISRGQAAHELAAQLVKEFRLAFACNRSVGLGERFTVNRGLEFGECLLLRAREDHPDEDPRGGLGTPDLLPDFLIEYPPPTEVEVSDRRIHAIELQQRLL